MQELAITLGREVVEFPGQQRPFYGPDPETTATRLEWLLRRLWADALNGDKGAMRCLLEYMVGKPAQQAPEPERSEEPPLSREELVRIAEIAAAKVQEWRKGKAGQPSSEGRNG